PPRAHDAVCEAQLGDARTDRGPDRSDRHGGPRQRRAVLYVERTARTGPLPVPGAPRPKEGPGRATGVDEGPTRWLDRGVTGLPRGRRCGAVRRPGRRTAPHLRSEEHTSELQSRFDLVCRLLLEKKNE